MNIRRTHAAFLLCLAPLGAKAHPHVFVDASARFVIEDGRLASVEIEHLYDPLVSLFVLQELGVDPFAPLSPEDATRLAGDQAVMLEEGDGFAALSVGGAAVALGAPQDIVVRMTDDRMQVSFIAPLAAPQPLAGRDATLAIFDPVYFIAFDLTGTVTVEGDADCAAAAVEWAPTDGLLSLQSTLMDLALDEMPENPTVGPLFAAEARLSCR
jgi:polyphosphate kinase